MLDKYPSLHQTVRVAADGTVTHGIDVPHEAANIRCEAVLGQVQPWLSEGDDTVVNIRCRNRVGHRTPKGEEPHVPVDIREVASPRRVVHTERFKPNTIPAGVDLNAVLIEHDCANHLPDTVEVLRRGW